MLQPVSADQRSAPPGPSRTLAWVSHAGRADCRGNLVRGTAVAAKGCLRAIERTGVNEERATRVVANLRERGVFAHVERAGVYQFGVRVVLPDGRQAVWDTDGTSALEATVMRDGVLVGFVPTVPGSEDLDDAGVVEAIAAADYDARR